MLSAPKSNNVKLRMSEFGVIKAFCEAPATE